MTKNCIDVVTSSLEKQATRLAEILRRAGEPEAEVQRRVQRALNFASSRKPKPGQTNPFEGCQSVTATAREMRISRIDLFEWLARAGWLYRTTDGWRPTDEALAAGWAVLRGRGAVQWVQITEAGQHEIARRIGFLSGEPHRE